MDKVILLVNDSPELTEQFIQFLEVFGHTQNILTVIDNINNNMQKNQFNKIILNYSGVTVYRNTVNTYLTNLSADNKVLVIDDDYYFKTSGITEYLNSNLTGNDRVGLIVNGEIKLLYGKVSDLNLNDLSNVVELQNIDQYFENQKVLNSTRNYIPI